MGYCTLKIGIGSLTYNHDEVAVVEEGRQKRRVDGGDIGEGVPGEGMEERWWSRW
jgi:hypothetical protein